MAWPGFPSPSGGWKRDRPRDLEAIAEYHRSKCADDPRRSLDDRTWSDLDMDAVFASLDRTGSTLGQQALYHRLRTAPVADHLDAFDALVNRLGADPALRARVQRVLARLRNPSGYDLWWLTQPDAIDTRPWHVIFPFLTLISPDRTCRGSRCSCGPSASTRCWRSPAFQVRSCIARTDDLLTGKSYYIAEVEAVLALVRANQSDAPHLFLFDELFRGTNPVERIAAAKAVLFELPAPAPSRKN